MKILYLGFSGIGEANATGQTLTSLYADLPVADYLELIYNKETAGSPTNCLEIPRSVAPIDLIKWKMITISRRLRGRWNHSSETGLNDSVRVSEVSLGTRFLRSARALVDLSPVWIPRTLLEKVKQSSPEVIHSLLGNVRMMKVAVILSRKLGIPIVPHFMDDWPSTLYPNNEIWGLARISVNRSLEKVMLNSPVLICIGKQMASVYQQRYEKPTFVAAYGVEESNTSLYLAAETTTRRLVYAGGLHLGRKEVIEWVASCLHGTDWKVEVYATKKGKSHEKLSYKNPTSVNELKKVLANADALLFVESFLPGIAESTKLSVSTKTAQYVVANRPAILVGPRGQASIELLKEFLACSRHITELTEKSSLELNRFLTTGVRGRIKASKVPKEFTGQYMREALLSAFNVAHITGAIVGDKR